MAMLFELKKQREEALNKAESIIAVAENAKRPLTENEAKDVDTAMAEASALAPQIERIEKMNTLRSQFPKGQVIADPTAAEGKSGKSVFSAQYAADYAKYLSSMGREIGAAMYEGSNAGGGYAVPVTVDGSIVPLATAETCIRSLANVIPTTHDIKFPRKASHGTAAAKSESGGADNAFAGTSPTLNQFTLSAFMAGDIVDASWELLQDVAAMGPLLNEDLQIAVTQYEEPKFIKGTGVGEPEGVLTGADVTTAVAGVTINGILDLMGALNPIYYPNSQFLMQRAVGIAIRKLQITANLFDKVWDSVGGVDYLFGYKVNYCASMDPGTGTGKKPLVFGDFKRGYLIGDRGGSGISVKVLDQPKANLGLTQFLAYRRTDGRVRRSEALKSYVLA